MDAVFEKLGVYELFSIFFAGSVITYSSIMFNDRYFNIGIFLSSNGLNNTFLFILISCFVGFLFQELGSIVNKYIIFRGKGLLKKAYSKEKTGVNHLSAQEFKKLEALFKKNNIIDLEEKYNTCKYYIINNGSTSRIDKDLALSSMSRSFFLYFFIISLILLIYMIANMDGSLVLPFALSVFVSVLMFLRQKRFAIMRYVSIFRAYLYNHNDK